MANSGSGMFVLLIGLLLWLSGCVMVRPVQAPPPAAPFSNGLIDQRKNQDAVYRIDVVSRGGHGSGSVLTHEGHILTVHHVAASGGDLSVILYEEGNPYPLQYDAKLVAADARRDIAVVKIDRKFRDVVILGNDNDAKVGDEVYNIGYPFDYGEMVARGHVMRKNFSLPENPLDKRPIEDRIVVKDIVLTDILAGPGTSGSGIFSAKNGRLVGAMRVLIFKGHSAGTLMVTRGYVPVSQIKDFLRQHRIPYYNYKGELVSYPPLPPPAKKPAAAPDAPAKPKQRWTPSADPKAPPAVVTPSTPTVVKHLF